MDAARAGVEAEAAAERSIAMEGRSEAGIHSVWNMPVTRVGGIGLERAGQLARLKIFTVGDLLMHAPRRYEDRRFFAAIRELKEGQTTTVMGVVRAMGTKLFRQGTRQVFEVILEEGGTRLHCRWWNVPNMERWFSVGESLIVTGKVRSIRPRSMDHPETEHAEAGEENSLHCRRWVPMYPLTEGVTHRWMRTWVWRALEMVIGAIGEPYPGLVSLGDGVGQWLSREAAVRALHFPESMEQVERGRSRLALDEFLELQVALQRRRRNLEADQKGLPCGGDNRWMRPFLAGLPFRLTEAQTRVLKEIRVAMSGKHPMRRLLQGDVGSGKTLVAACAALMALESGYSAVLMAPTEILAEQHAMNFRRWWGGVGIPVWLRTATHRERRGEGDGGGGDGKSGEVGLIVGTHALLEDGVEIPRLGLVVIDEQHKFGVAQRERLVRKGQYPHLLVMTATPIPRTLGLTLYGDLDVSVLEKGPEGRGRVRTHLRSPDRLPQVWAFIRGELERGRQAYVVYPRVSESDGDEVRAVTRDWPRVVEAVAPHAVGMLHGQMPAVEKERVMGAFRAGEVKVLLATSVIEVGVDVPNASVMLIENAEKFGLSQLHQLRGRIGRGPGEAHCILVVATASEASRERLETLVRCGDGFELAEEDLRLRGPGDFLGKAQSGAAEFRFADLWKDRAILEVARDLAGKVVRVELAEGIGGSGG